MTNRKALLVRGGWDGHEPVAATDSFRPFLESSGFDIVVHDSPEVYADADEMGSVDLIVQCMTMTQITQPQVDGLRAAVANGTGMTGWHGGIADSYRDSSDYLHLIGGQFATHPAVGPEPGASCDRDYRVVVTKLGQSHPITAGIDDFEVRSEQYWVLHDDLIDVLATTTHPAEDWQPWHRPVTSPAVWTREWGAGRIVVTTPGHNLQILEHPSVRHIIQRGMLWAARREAD